ncbi:MAG: hypothetical protein Q9187_001446 [Circinaria calcarea]
MSPRKQAVTITFSSPGAKPPVFVAGTFTEPPWEPHELSFEICTPEDGQGDLPEYHFFKTFDVAAGEYQYKFRLGPVTDAAGNRNNMLHVDIRELSATTAPHDNKHIQVRFLRDKAVGVDPSTMSETSNIMIDDTADVHKTDVQENHRVAPEAPRVTSTVSDATSKEVLGELADCTLLVETSPREGDAPGSDPSKSDVVVVHVKEVLPLSQNGRDRESVDENILVDTGKISDDDADKIRRFLPQQRQAEIADELEKALEEDSQQSLNFPEKNKHSHAPLFSHECLQCPEIAAPHCHKISSPSREVRRTIDESQYAAPHVPNEAEILDDPTIEIFPSEPMDILKRMATLHSQLPEDDSVEEDTSSPLYSPTFAGHPSPMLSHEKPVHALPTPRYSFDAEADGTSDPRPILQSKSSSPLRRPTAYRTGHSRHSFEQVKESDEEEREPLLRPEDPWKPALTPPALSHPSSEELRRRKTEADSLSTTASVPDSSDSADRGLGFFGAFFDALFHWFGSCLFGLLGRKSRE